MSVLVHILLSLISSVGWSPNLREGIINLGGEGWAMGGAYVAQKSEGGSNLFNPAGIFSRARLSVYIEGGYRSGYSEPNAFLSGEKIELSRDILLPELVEIQYNIKELKAVSALCFKRTHRYNWYFYEKFPCVDSQGVIYDTTQVYHEFNSSTYSYNISFMSKPTGNLSIGLRASLIQNLESFLAHAYFSGDEGEARGSFRGYGISVGLLRTFSSFRLGICSEYQTSLHGVNTFRGDSLIQIDPWGYYVLYGTDTLEYKQPFIFRIGLAKDNLYKWNIECDVSFEEWESVNELLYETAPFKNVVNFYFGANREFTKTLKVLWGIYYEPDIYKSKRTMDETSYGGTVGSTIRLFPYMTVLPYVNYGVVCNLTSDKGFFSGKKRVGVGIGIRYSLL